MSRKNGLKHKVSPDVLKGFLEMVVRAIQASVQDLAEGQISITTAVFRVRIKGGQVEIAPGFFGTNVVDSFSVFLPGSQAKSLAELEALLIQQAGLNMAVSGFDQRLLGEENYLPEKEFLESLKKEEDEEE